MPSRLSSRAAGQHGFTLLEIMVVIFIIGLLIAIVAPNVLSNQDDAMQQKARADISTLEQALQDFDACFNTASDAMSCLGAPILQMVAQLPLQLSRWD